MKRPEKGQALVEMALAAPVFALMLWGSIFLARACIERLNLLNITREFAVLLSRNEANSGGPRMMLRDLRTLAWRFGMKPEALSYELKPLYFAEVAGQAGGIALMAGKSLKLATAIAAGERLTVTYEAPLRFPFFGKRMVMTETLAIKTNPWRDPMKQGLTKLFMD